MAEKILVGAHTSISGGVFNAVYEGQKIGATTIQVFTSNQRQWKGRRPADEDISQWFEALEKTGISQTMSHDSYLINLGSSKPELLEKSRAAFKEEIERCHLLKIPLLNFHPGAAIGYSEEECLDTIVQSLLSLKPTIDKGSTKMVLELTAGQGSNVGYKFEQIGYIIDRTKDQLPMGVCIDTCHIFSAGYDIRTYEGWENTLEEFDKLIGLEFLVAFHLNDSMKPLAERKDRHANLGKGEIGLASFEFLMTHPKTKYLPKYLETPNGETYWPEEIILLKDFASKCLIEQE